MEDPYKILGLSSSSSDEEITAAYRKLAKKYHPDLNPGDKGAEQKMSRINAAYEQIKNEKTGGASYERPDGSYGQQGREQPGGSYYNPYGGFDFGGFEDIFSQFFGQAWGQQSNEPSPSPAFRQVQMYIQTRQYQSALHELSQVYERNGEWYYFSALANAGIGNRVTAMNHAKEAVLKDPGNMSYRQLLAQLQQSGFAYQDRGQSSGFNMQSMGRTFFQIMLANILCFFCCRPC
ncbi:MAG: DnaJ domain-containing protein [Clostridiaceae bacterium]|nr:DnaJ domain-containing protein [Clostridiaceae bacterium]